MIWHARDVEGLDSRRDVCVRQKGVKLLVANSTSGSECQEGTMQNVWLLVGMAGLHRSGCDTAQRAKAWDLCASIPL